MARYNHPNADTFQRENNLTPLEFQHALEMGLGRAIQHLRSHDPTPYQGAIMRACLIFTGLNLQSEGGRHEYLFEAIALAADSQAIQDSILEAIKHLTDDGESNQQLIELVVMMAHSGSVRAKEAIIALFERDPEEHCWPCAEAIMQLDGLPGLQLVLNTFGQAMLRDPELQENTYTLEGLMKLDGLVGTA